MPSGIFPGKVSNPGADIKGQAINGFHGKGKKDDEKVAIRNFLGIPFNHSQEIVVILQCYYGADSGAGGADF